MTYTQIKPKHIAEYLEARSAPVAANHEIKLLSKVFKHAINWGWCETNPCRDAMYHPEKPRDRYATPAEIELLKSHATEQWRVVIDLMCLTGMRRGDIINLKLTDITDEGVYNQQNKTGKKQCFTWTTELASVIERAKKCRKVRNITYLFTNQHGQQITKTGYNSATSRIRKKADLMDIHFHDIRGSALTDAEKDGDIHYAQSLAGHDSLATTEGYLRRKKIDYVKPLK